MSVRPLRQRSVDGLVSVKSATVLTECSADPSSVSCDRQRSTGGHRRSSTARLPLLDCCLIDAGQVDVAQRCAIQREIYSSNQIKSNRNF